MQRLLLDTHRNAVRRPQVTAVQIDLEPVKTNNPRKCARRSHSTPHQLEVNCTLTVRAESEIAVSTGRVIPRATQLTCAFPSSSSRHLFVTSRVTSRPLCCTAQQCDGAATQGEKHRSGGPHIRKDSEANQSEIQNYEEELK
jgi:hypothetical protein